MGVRTWLSGHGDFSQQRRVVDFIFVFVDDGERTGLDPLALSRLPIAIPMALHGVFDITPHHIDHLVRLGQ